MEVLDTSIANVALPHIALNLGASSDESTWVLTSYLVSNAIVLPTGSLVSLVGRKRFFLICISIFTVSSLLCCIALVRGNKSAGVFIRGIPREKTVELAEGMETSRLKSLASTATEVLDCSRAHQQI